MYWSPRRWTRLVESSMSTKRSVTTPLGNGAPVNPRQCRPGSGCVRERVVEGVERLVPRHADLERIVGLRVVDRDDEAVVVAVPEEGHVDAVVLPVCEFFGHGGSLSLGARAYDEAARCLGRGYPAAWGAGTRTPAGSGIAARTDVPSPAGLSTTSLPSSASTRSTSPRRPVPRLTSAPPTPSSTTSITAWASSHVTRTRAYDACAYFATLVSASETT